MAEDTRSKIYVAAEREHRSFLSGPNTNTLPLQIFSDIQWQGDPTIAVASTLQIVVVTMLIVIRSRVAF